MDDNGIHLIGRIDQIVRDYFLANPSVNIDLAKNFMPLFIEKGIFEKDTKAGKPIRDLLRELDSEKKLNLLHHCTVVRKTVNRNWYFERPASLK
jgi:hypothetical protein